MKVIGNENTSVYWTDRIVDRKQMKKVQHRAQKKAWEMMKI